MGHYCRICGCRRPNEKFSGRGHRTHVCKECSRLPQDEREATELAEELLGYLKQSRISPKNIKRLGQLAKSANAEISEHARLVLEIAQVMPTKRRRLKFLAREHPELLGRLKETGLIYAHHF